MSEDADELERRACTPAPVNPGDFNPLAVMPYSCATGDIHQAMTSFIQFLQLVNQQLHASGMLRLESLLMPANFSGIVSEFMNVSIPKSCRTLVKNGYHNGHPDLIPVGTYPGNAVQYAHEGIEIKASRYPSGWQGHNAEESWLMVFVFDSNRPPDVEKGIAPRPFRFVKVVGAQLQREDWSFSGRYETSRRTITASVTPAGHAKMEANWIYRAPGDASEVPVDQPEMYEDTLSEE